MNIDRKIRQLEKLESLYWRLFYHAKDADEQGCIKWARRQIEYKLHILYERKRLGVFMYCVSKFNLKTKIRRMKYTRRQKKIIRMLSDHVSKAAECQREEMVSNVISQLNESIKNDK